jgi:hypothetical protein
MSDGSVLGCHRPVELPRLKHLLSATWSRRCATLPRNNASHALASWPPEDALGQAHSAARSLPSTCCVVVLLVFCRTRQFRRREQHPVLLRPRHERVYHFHLSWDGMGDEAISTHFWNRVGYEATQRCGEHYHRCSGTSCVRYWLNCRR